MEAFVGTIILWPANFVPAGWMLCDGTLLNVQTYAALYSLLGTRFGGNGSSTFGLPDLRNRVPFGTVNAGQAILPYQTTASATTAPLLLAAAGDVAITGVPPHTHGAALGGSLGGTASGNISLPVVGSGTASGPVGLGVTGTGTVTASGTANIASTAALTAAKIPASGDYLISNATAAVYGSATGAVSAIPLGGTSAVQVSGTATLTGGTASGSVSLPVTMTGASASGAVSLPVALGGTATVTVGPAVGSPIQHLSLPIPSLPMNYIICVNGLYPSRN